MKRTSTTAIAALAALAWLPASVPASGQETTAQEVLEALRLGERVESAPRWMDINTLASFFLRQVDPSSLMCTEGEDRCRFEPAPRTSAELDAFADQVAAIAADSTLPDRVRSNASSALASAVSRSLGRSNVGTPYPRAFDLLVRVYEGGYDDALDDIWRTDSRAFDLLVRVYEGGYEGALYDIWRTDSVRGPAYVREVFERSERPPLCRRYRPVLQECDGYDYWDDARPTLFCRAGMILFDDMVSAARERAPSDQVYDLAGVPDPIPPGLPEHVEDRYRRCR